MKKDIKIAIVHDWLTGMRGGEKVLEVFCELFPTANLYTLIHIKGTVSSTIENLNINTSFIQKLPFIKKKYRYYLPLFPTAIEQFDLKRYDLILSTSHCVAKGIIPYPHSCHISYVHTPMRYIWDKYHDYFPPQKKLISRFFIPIISNYLRLWDVTSSTRVDYFISNSLNVAQRIKRYYNRESEVVHPPVDTEYFKIKDAENENFYLIVSALVPYKKLEIAIMAFNILQLPLKIIGTGPEEKKLKKMSKSNIDFLSWQPCNVIKEFYEKCKAVVFPGEEDFGIVPLEAMACGKPVIAFGRGGVLETVLPLEKPIKNSHTGVFFQDQTAKSLINAIKFYEQNKTLLDRYKIRSHAQKFSREIFKQALKKAIYKKYDAFQRSSNSLKK